MKWKLAQDKESMVSHCAIFRITNLGEKNGDRYVVHKWDARSETYCMLVRVGTVKECMNHFDEKDDQVS